MSSVQAEIESSDVAILDYLRKVESVTVTDLAEAMRVTATAVRQRLNRLMGQSLIERHSVPSGRGRPSHQYRLTDKGRRKTGANFADLAIALWNEIRAVNDLEVRRGLLKRLATTLSDLYGDQISGETPGERMISIKNLFNERNVPFSVDKSGQLPVLTAEACPYPTLAEQDRGICALERLLFTELVQEDLRLTACRLDGASCCTFEMASSEPILGDSAAT